MNENKKTKLISPIKNAIDVPGATKHVIYGQDGLDIRFFSPSKGAFLLLTDKGWSELREDDFFDRATGYAHYAKHFKNLPENQKAAQIDAMASPESNYKTPLVISHRHTLALVKKLQISEEKHLTTKSKNSEEFKLSTHYKQMTSLVSRLENRVPENAPKVENVQAPSKPDSPKKPLANEEQTQTLNHNEVEEISEAEEKIIANKNIPWHLRLFNWKKLFGKPENNSKNPNLTP